MKKRLTAIVNPISGIGKHNNVERLLNSNLDKDQYDYEVLYTEAAHHGTQLAREAAERGVDVVVACGGDGSVNDIALGLQNSETKLGIIPCGSGNGLARCLRIPLIPALAIKVLNHYHEEPIDTIELNGEHLVTSIAGVGFDADIAKMMKRARLRGFGAYMKFILQEYPSYKSKDYRFYINGEEKAIERNAWFISLANSNQFGYNAAVAPKAKLNDGLIDISVVERIPLDHFAITVPLVYAQHFELSQHVEMLQAREVVVTGNVDRWVNIDGEGYEVGEELHFVNRRHALKVLTPPEPILTINKNTHL